MIIWLDDELFAPDHANDVDRIALLREAHRRRHTLFVSDSPGRPDASRPNLEKWTRALSQPLGSETEALLAELRLVPADALAYGSPWVCVPGPKRAAIENAPALSVNEAVRALGHPLTILVENQLNDGAFLRAMMPPPWSARLEDWERTGQVRFGNGGGINVLHALIEHHCDGRGSARGFGLPAEVWKLLHFIVVDHDGPKPDAPSADSKRVGSLCQERGLSQRFHRLERRCPENYLPMAVLLSHSSDPDFLKRVEDYKQLSEPARFFDRRVLQGDGVKRLFYSSEHRGQPVQSDPSCAAEMSALAEKIAAAM